MKSKMNKIVLFLTFMLSTSSCSLMLDDVYEGNAYNSPIFSENYYCRWDEQLKSNVTSTEEYELKDSIDQVFETYSENTFEQNSGLSYSDDNPLGVDDPNLYGKAYGETRKMSRVDDSFRYGYLSKLFDGQMFCNGRYQLARVQLNEEGFGHMFDKEVKDFDKGGNSYFAMNFKAAVDYTNEEKESYPHFSSIKMYVSFYTKNTDNTLNQIKTIYKIENIPTNYGESHSEGCYRFYGFALDGLDLSRLCGISIEFELIEDELHDEYGLDYSIMVYEMMIPFTTWY